MKTYKNDYNKNGNKTLWKLHEIGNKIQHKIITTPQDKLNDSSIKRNRHALLLNIYSDFIINSQIKKK
ncbi:MAG TPA: hypothetical protein PLM75_10125 [bacterium]|nr:hypothetical protein [bacterium]